jgi:hypothetical protein
MRLTNGRVGSPPPHITVNWKPEEMPLVSQPGQQRELWSCNPLPGLEKSPAETPMASSSAWAAARELTKGVL